MKKFLCALIFLIYSSICFAQVPMTGAGLAKPSAGGGGITFTPTDAKSAAPAFSSGSISGIAIGIASSDRIVTFCFQAHTGAGLASPPTVNGGTAVTAAAGTLTADNVVLYYINLTTGTTMSVDFVGGADGISVAVGVLKGQSGGGGATPSSPVAPGGNSGAGAQPLTLALTVPASGIGVACTGQVAVPGTYTWTGTTAGGGDETTAGPATTTQSGLAHSTSTGTIGLSSTTFVFSGTMAGAAWAP